MAKRSANPRRFLSADDEAQIEDAVRAAESKTTAEIRLALVRHAWGDPQTKAVQVFRELGLAETKERNAVLILVVTANRELVIYGDTGIDRLVKDDLWQRACTGIIGHFKTNQVAAGLVAGINLIGIELANHFPRTTADDQNELPDEVAHVQ